MCQTGFSQVPVKYQSSKTTVVFSISYVRYNLASSVVSQVPVKYQSSKITAVYSIIYGKYDLVSSVVNQVTVNYPSITRQLLDGYSGPKRQIFLPFYPLGLIRQSAKLSKKPFQILGGTLAVHVKTSAEAFSFYSPKKFVYAALCCTKTFLNSSGLDQYDTVDSCSINRKFSDVQTSEVSSKRETKCKASGPAAK